MRTQLLQGLAYNQSAKQECATHPTTAGCPTTSTRSYDNYFHHSNLWRSRVSVWSAGIACDRTPRHLRPEKKALVLPVKVSIRLDRKSASASILRGLFATTNDTVATAQN